MSEILLPRRHLSYTQMTCWVKNKPRYRKEYFEGGPKLDTKYLRFGKGIAELIEENKHQDLLPDLVVYPMTELEIRTTILGVPILAFVDDYHPDLNVFREKKTGKVPWTQSRVQKHEQLVFYAAALESFKGRMPEYCHLDWMETKEDVGDDFWSRVDKKVILTGKVLPFKREFDPREVERMKELVLKTAQEISRAYKAFINEI